MCPGGDVYTSLGDPAGLEGTGGSNVEIGDDMVFYGETKKTDLWSKRTGSADLADLDDLGGVWRHGLRQHAGFWRFRDWRRGDEREAESVR